MKFDSRYLSPFQVVSRLLPKVIPREMCLLTWICFSETIKLGAFELHLIICNRNRQARRRYLWYIFYHGTTAPSGPRPFPLSRIHDHTHLDTHTHTHTRYDSSGRVISPTQRQRPLPHNTQHSQETDIHAPGWIRTHNPSKRAAADPRIRPCDHWDRYLWCCLAVLLRF